MGHDKVILALDCSIGTGSLSLCVNDDVYHVTLDTQNMQAASLIPKIEQLFKKTDCDYSDLTDLSTTIGPGSFTGIRIGLSIARTIAYAFPNIYARSFTTLQSIAAMYHDESIFKVALKAGRKEAYVQSFTRQNASLVAIDDIQLTPLDQLAGVLIGNVEGCTKTLTPSSEGLLQAIRQFSEHNSTLSPLYIRPPDAALPTKPAI